MNRTRATNNGMTDTQRATLTGDLAEKIRALGFVKAEIELYLDTHPDCIIALDYYHRTVDELKRLVEEYLVRIESGSAFSETAKAN